MEDIINESGSECYKYDYMDCNAWRTNQFEFCIDNIELLRLSCSKLIVTDKKGVIVIKVSFDFSTAVNKLLNESTNFNFDSKHSIIVKLFKSDQSQKIVITEGEFLLKEKTIVFDTQVSDICTYDVKFESI